MHTSIEKIKENEITELNFTATGIDEDYMTYLVEALEKNTSITKFFFDLCSMQANELKILRDALLLRKKIEYVGLGQNGLSDESEVHIAALISHNTISGMVIRISGNEFKNDCKRRLEKLAAQHGVKLVTEFPRCETAIDNTTGTLNLSNTAFDIRLGELISGQIKANASINRFLLNNSQLFDDDLATLHEVLLQKKTIAFMDISNNSLSDKSIPFLIQLMSNNARLELNVSGNQFSNEGRRKLLKTAITSKDVKLIANSSDSPKPKRPFFNETHANGSHSDGDLYKGNGHKFDIKGKR
jgi:hypothetical protein